MSDGLKGFAIDSLTRQTIDELRILLRQAEAAYQEMIDKRDEQIDDLERIRKAGVSLVKCWADGTFAEMWISHMGTFRQALDDYKAKWGERKERG